MNALYVIGLPFLLWLIVKSVRKQYRAKKFEVPNPPGWRFKLIFVLVILWFMVRNIPHESFQWTRPTPDTIFDR